MSALDLGPKCLQSLSADDIIGIKHPFSCINVPQVPREMLKTEAERLQPQFSTLPEGPDKCYCIEKMRLIAIIAYTHCISAKFSINFLHHIVLIFNGSYVVSFRFHILDPGPYSLLNNMCGARCGNSHKFSYLLI